MSHNFYDQQQTRLLHHIYHVYTQNAYTYEIFKQDIAIFIDEYLSNFDEFIPLYHTYIHTYPNNHGSRW